MSEEDDFEAVLEAVAECVKAIGDEVEGKITANDGSDVIGYQCSRGPLSYLVHGRRDSEFFTIQYPADVISGIADILDESDAQEILSEDAIPSDPEDLTSGLLRRQAAVYVLDQQDEELMSKLEYEASTILSSSDTSFSWRRTDENTFAGFDVHRKVFPYREEFDVVEFDNAARAVIATGNLGSNFLTSSVVGGVLASTEPLSDPSSEPDSGDLRSFQ